MGEYRKRERRLVLFAACFAAFVSPLTGSMITLSLSDISVDLGATLDEISRVSAMYYTFTIPLLLPAARLADIFGKRRIFLLGSIIGSLALFANFFVADIVMFYVCRAAVAVGSALVSGTSVSMILETYPSVMKSTVLAYHTACTFMGDSAGPSLGGLVTSCLGWRFNFLIVAVLYLAAAICIYLFPHGLVQDGETRFNFKNACLYGLGMVFMMIGFQYIPKTFSFVLIAVGLVIMVGYVIMERRSENPVMKLSLLRNATLVSLVAACTINVIATFSVTLYMGMYLEDVIGKSPQDAGLILTAMPLSQIVTTLLIGKVSGKLDIRILPIVGMLVSMTGLIMMVLFLNRDFNLTNLIIILMVSGVGLGMFASPNKYALASCVDKADHNKAFAIYDSARKLGSVLSMSLVSILIVTMVGEDSTVGSHDLDAFMEMLRFSWIVSAVMCALGALLIWFKGKVIDPNP